MQRKNQPPLGSQNIQPSPARLGDTGVDVHSVNLRQVISDAGANMGQWAQKVSKAFPAVPLHLIEPQAARLAALRSEPSDLALMKRYAARAAMAEDWASWDRWDELFHRSVVEASGNGLIISIVDQILRVKKQTRWTITRAKTFDPGLRDRYSSEHLAIIASIEAHDLKGAEDAMVQHIQGISCSIGPAISRTAMAT